MSYEIIKLSEENLSAWDDFCLTSDEAWFWHTSTWLDYALNYKPDLKTHNLSFLVCRQDKIKAIVPITLETSERGASEFSFGGFALPAPALANDLDRLEKDRPEKEIVSDFIYEEIGRLAEKNRVKKAWLRQTPLAPAYLAKKICHNKLLERGFIDVSLNTRLIDLSKGEAELWGELRRNHRRNINKAEGFKVLFYTKENIDDGIFSAYKAMHHKAAGRQTRPAKTFELMYDWLKQDLAFLAAVEFENKLIGFEYYSVYKNNVYGFSAANDPDYEKDYPVRHKLEWQAILWMKKQDFDFYEIGLQQYGDTFFDFPDKKQLDITHFKKGFGGFTAPWFMGEKYYNKEYFLAIYSDRIKKYAEKL